MSENDRGGHVIQLKVKYDFYVELMKLYTFVLYEMI